VYQRFIFILIHHTDLPVISLNLHVDRK